MTDPTPQTTPTRDEAVPTGWKLVPIEPTDEMVAAWPRFNKGAGHERAIYAAMLASAPAPASGGVDVVSAQTMRDKAEWHVSLGRRRDTVFSSDEVLGLIASLSPAATPVSEAEPVAWMHPTAGWFAPSRDTIAMHCRSDEPPVPVYLAKPASSAAGGVEIDQEALDVARKVYNETLGNEWRCGATERVVRTYLDALSQSTSAGRVGE